jgi:hypothetical protein
MPFNVIRSYEKNSVIFDVLRVESGYGTCFAIADTVDP